MTVAKPAGAFRVPILIALLVLGLSLTGCGGGGDAKTDGADAAPAAPPVQQDSMYAGGWEPVSGDDPASTADFADPGAFTHKDGRFRVYWPKQCYKFRTRTIGDADSPEGLEMVHAFGVVKNDEECGVSVTVWFRESDGSAATPESITANLSSLIARRGLTLTNQRVIQRLGMQGVAAYMKDEKTGILYWTEVYLYKGRTLMVSAWDRGDYMFEDPELQRFFRSVEFVD